MSVLSKLIVEYAGKHPVFTASELVASVPSGLISSRSTLEWHLGQLVRAGKLARIGKGRYTTNPRPAFLPSPEETDASLYHLLKEWYPETTFCVYRGCIFSSLQHHLSYNAMTYIETQREVTEALFHRFQDEEKLVFHRPDKKVFNEYVDITKPGFIIKPLITGSPLQEVDGVMVPMLEKLLVDIHCDADFDYMAGSESARMLENAVSLFTINATKLLRYAGRRHCREVFEQELNDLGL